MVVVHLLASPFVGGPEKQLLGLAAHMPPEYRTVFLSFAESGKCQPFLDEARKIGVEAHALTHNFPHLLRAINEVAERLRDLKADMLVCNGYKPDLVGWRAARRLGIPVLAISHGWTGATWKVRLYEKLDAFVCQRLDAVVGVSQAQGNRLEAAGVPESNIVVIPNAVGDEAFAGSDPSGRGKLLALFEAKPRLIVGAAGRLSPEKGFDQLIEASRQFDHDVGLVIFGDGPLRESLQRQIGQLGLTGRVVLAGFRSDLAGYLPHLDVGVLSSHTEGLPVILLEMQAAGVAVVATSVGGIPEVIVDGTTGLLVPPADIAALATGIQRLTRDDALRARLADSGRQRVQEHFSCAGQAEMYQKLFTRLAGKTRTDAQPLAGVS